MLKLFAKLASGVRRALQRMSSFLLSTFASPWGHAAPFPEADEFIPEEPADFVWDSYTPNLSTDVVRLRDLARDAVRGQHIDLDEAGISEPLRKWFRSLNEKQVHQVSATSGLQLYRHLKQISLLNGLPLLLNPRQRASRQIQANNPPKRTTRNAHASAQHLGGLPALPWTELPRRQAVRTLDALLRDKEALKRRIEAAHARTNADPEFVEQKNRQETTEPDLSDVVSGMARSY